MPLIDSTLFLLLFLRAIAAYLVGIIPLACVPDPRDELGDLRQYRVAGKYRVPRTCCARRSKKAGRR